MFCPKCGANLPDGAAFCGSCGSRLQAASPRGAAGVAGGARPGTAAGAVPFAGKAPAVKRGRGPKVAIAAVAAVVVVAVVLVAGRFLPFLKHDPTIYQAGELFSMQPAELADYLESHDMRFLDMSTLPEEWTDKDASVQDQVNLGSYANRYFKEPVIGVFNRALNGEYSDTDYDRDEIISTIQNATDGGYICTVSVMGRGFLDAMTGSGLPTPEETGKNSAAITYSYGLNLQELRAGNPYYSISVGFRLPQTLYGSDERLPTDELESRLNDILGRSGLPAPARSVTYKHSSSDYYSLRYAYGFFGSNGRECFYVANFDANGSGFITVSTLADAYAFSGVGDKDSLIEKRMEHFESSGTYERVS